MAKEAAVKNRMPAFSASGNFSPSNLRHVIRDLMSVLRFFFFSCIILFEERKFLGKLWKFKFATQYRGKVIGCHWQPLFVLLDFISIRRHSSRIYWFHQIALDFITNLALLSIAFCFVLDILASLLRQTRQEMQESRHVDLFLFENTFLRA